VIKGGDAMLNKLSRRQLLKALLAVAGGASLQQLAGGLPPATQAQTMDNFVYLPIILKNGVPTPPTTTPPPSSARVVHVYNSSATTGWNYGLTYYGNYVSQSVVNTMVNSGVMALTGASTVAGAWQALLSRISPYSSGKKIAIKVNFNNSDDCSTSDTASDALFHPINAMISGLQAAGVQLNDIWVFDAIRGLPSRFINGITTKTQIRFLDAGTGSCGGVTVQTATWNSSDSSATVNFTHPGLADQKVADILVGATYVINVPILRGHSMTGVTFGFKNHLGCIPNPLVLHDPDPPGYIRQRGVEANPNSHPLVDLYRNQNIAGKTILTVGDGLFGGNQYLNTAPPARWPNTFKSILGTDAPNSLFFATDPVALDCVMSDIIKEEIGGMDDWAVHYLVLAHAAGLGTFEQGSPWATPIGSGYSQIEYMRI
jgi:hypothetical protein